MEASLNSFPGKILIINGCIWNYAPVISRRLIDIDDCSQSQFCSRRPLRLERVCVAVTGSDASEMVEKAEALVRDNPFVEFRLDYLSTPALALPEIKRFIDFYRRSAIATCRRVANGGKFKGTVAAEIDLLNKAAAAGCQLVDVELQSGFPESHFNSTVKPVRATDTFVSRLRGTKKLEETFGDEGRYPADFYKVVSTATNLYDNVTMMKFLEHKGDRHSMVGLCMGEQGIISRVLGARAGSAFTFAAASPDEKTAPGQAKPGNW